MDSFAPRPISLLTSLIYDTRHLAPLLPPAGFQEWRTAGRQHNTFSFPTLDKVRKRFSAPCCWC